ncbi:MAG: helix-turn-helix domain-containing protein [Flavobacteriia bacterium]|jgi:predicted HTH transcriptional regulator
MESTLKDLIKQGEHQTLDFKFRIDDQKKIARTLAAFANSDGGKLLIGVKDNGKIAGINPEEEFHMIEGAAKLYCKPEVKFESKIWQEDFRLVLEIQVEKNLDRNHTALDEEGKWKIYIRKDDHTLLANKILLKVWNLEKKGLPKPQHFGKEELDFLKTLSNERRTLSQLYRLNTIPKIQVDQLLSLFVYWKIIQMEMSEEGSFYSII